MAGFDTGGLNRLGSGNQTAGNGGSPNRRAKWVDDLAARPALQKFASVLGPVADFVSPGAGRRSIDGAQQCSATRTKDALIIRRHFGSNFRLAFSAPHQASCRCESTKTQVRISGAIYDEFQIPRKTACRRQFDRSLDFWRRWATSKSWIVLSERVCPPSCTQ